MDVEQYGKVPSYSPTRQSSSRVATVLELFQYSELRKQTKVPQENIPNATAERVKRDMLKGVETALASQFKSPFYTKLQLWGAALPTNTPSVPCIFDPYGRAGICGDWLIGSSVQAAVLSGVSLADHIANYFKDGRGVADEHAIGLHSTFQSIHGHEIGGVLVERGEEMVAMMMASGLKISTTHILHHRRPYGRSRSVIVGSGQDWWKFPRLEKTGGVPSPSLSLSDILWPSAGAFAAMAALGRLDQMIAHKGVTFTIAPLGAVCAVLFTTPSSPAAKRKNMFMAQIACGLFGVLALAAFGPGWVARSFGVAASVAFMITTGAVHPPAASLPILFIDAAKFHQLQFWYLLFPGATGCVLLCLVQEMVFYMKANFRF